MAAMAAMVVTDRERRVMRQRLVAKTARGCCRFLPLFPPITRNVKLPNRATRLEFRLLARSALVKKSKNGKNGNVNCYGQHCCPP